MSATKRRAKFADVKVGDVVVINNDGEYHVGTVTQIEMGYQRPSFVVKHRNRYGDEELSVYTLATGAGLKDNWNWNSGSVIALNPPDAHKYRDSEEHRLLGQELEQRRVYFPRLTLSQLRRIRDILDEKDTP